MIIAHAVGVSDVISRGKTKFVLRLQHERRAMYIHTHVRYRTVYAIVRSVQYTHNIALIIITTQRDAKSIMCEQFLFTRNRNASVDSTRRNI